MAPAVNSGAAARISQTPEREKTTKKVRLACQRCRDRRIKCDGLTPSCSKCSKAGVPCIDVDARNGNHNLPRAFLTDAQARLEWLEDLVKTHAPDIDLTAGPRKPDSANIADVRRADGSSPVPRKVGERRPEIGSSTVQGPGEKRLRETQNEDLSTVSRKARRMALDLGLFSLNTNVSQAHYLGSSSGSFFANLLPHDDSANEPISDPDSDNENGSPEPRLQPDGPHHMLFKTLVETLPSRAECDRMVKLFYNYYHGDYPILHQPSFDRLVDALYVCSKAPSPTSMQHNGWPSCVAVFEYNGIKLHVNGKDAIAIPVRTAAAQLFFVLSIAADLQTRKRVFVADPSKFQSQALSLFQISLAEISVPSIQTMVLFVLQNFLTPEGGSIWVMLHIAQAYAIDLGLHRNMTSSPRISEAAIQMRRRTFFCVYVLDRLTSVIQGRPIGFQDETLDLAMPAMITAENENRFEQNDQATLPYSITHFNWARLISEIKHGLYRFIPENGLFDHLANTQTDIHTRLDLWSQQSTAAIDKMHESVRKRFLTKVQIDYHSAIGLLYQPSQLCPKPDAGQLRKCFDSATQRIRLYWSLYNQNNLSLSWPRTHGIFLAGATLVYCVWSSNDLRATIAIAELAADLRLCSSLLTLGGEWWPLAQRGRRSFERLADSTIKFLANRQMNDLDHQQLVSTSTSGLSTDPNQWLDVESMLQSFLQNEYQIPDMLDAIDASPFDPIDASWDVTSMFSNQYG